MEKGRLIRMAKVNIIYWSGTGNTAAMAAAIAEGAKEAGAEAELSQQRLQVQTMSGMRRQSHWDVRLMGAEQLEETIMEPLMEELDGAISWQDSCTFRFLRMGERRLDA